MAYLEFRRGSRVAARLLRRRPAVRDLRQRAAAAGSVALLPWPWAQAEAAALDVGPSGGTMACIAAAAGLLAAPWRVRAWLVLLGFIVGRRCSSGVRWPTSSTPSRCCSSCSSTGRCGSSAPRSASSASSPSSRPRPRSPSRSSPSCSRPTARSDTPTRPSGRGSTSRSTSSSSSSSRTGCAAGALGMGLDRRPRRASTSSPGCSSSRSCSSSGRRRSSRLGRRRQRRDRAVRAVGVLLGLPRLGARRLPRAPQGHARHRRRADGRRGEEGAARPRRRHALVDDDVGRQQLRAHARTGIVRVPDAGGGRHRARRSARARGVPATSVARVHHDAPSARVSSRASSARAMRRGMPCRRTGAASSSPTTRSSTCPGLEFTGKAWARGAHLAQSRRARGDDLPDDAARPTSRGASQQQLRAISEMWVGDKGLPEMGFTLGTLDEAEDPEVRLALAISPKGDVDGFLSWLPVYGGDGRVRGWTLDLMRRRDGGFGPVMEFLIGSSAQALLGRGRRDHVAVGRAARARVPAGCRRHREPARTGWRHARARLRLRIAAPVQGEVPPAVRDDVPAVPRRERPHAHRRGTRRARSSPTRRCGSSPARESNSCAGERD